MQFERSHFHWLEITFQSLVCNYLILTININHSHPKLIQYIPQKRMQIIDKNVLTLLNDLPARALILLLSNSLELEFPPSYSKSKSSIWPLPAVSGWPLSGSQRTPTLMSVVMLPTLSHVTGPLGQCFKLSESNILSNIKLWWALQT